MTITQITYRATRQVRPFEGITFEATATVDEGASANAAAAELATRVALWLDGELAALARAQPRRPAVSDAEISALSGDRAPA